MNIHIIFLYFANKKFLGEKMKATYNILGKFLKVNYEPNNIEDDLISV